MSSVDPFLATGESRESLEGDPLLDEVRAVLTEKIPDSIAPYLSTSPD